MPHEILHMSGFDPKRSAAEGFRRGLLRRCPNCGEGHLFQGYLSVAPRCDVCGLDNTVYRADDGPAYFTILIIGHLLIGPLLFLSIVRTWPPVTVVALTLPLVAAATLALLPFVKGAFIGVLWATRATAAQ
jgi:uncharacterized protein (DUF983 family)